MKENINALDEIHKGACMGVDAIKDVLDKVKDKSLTNELNNELNEYNDIAREIEKIYPKYNDGKPHETTIISKAMTWYHIEMETLTDESNSNLAELLLQGLNMGIIEGRKILNNKNLDNEIKDIVSKYVVMQEKNAETMKKYL